MTQTGKKEFRRLGTNILPEHYKISLKIDIELCKFDGTVEANIKVNEPCASILLDSIELNVSGVELQSGESKIAAKEIKELKDEDRVEFVMDELVPKGANVLRYAFAGSLNDKLRGLYRCKSKNAKGEDVYSASTHFEPSDCRRMFPCWDEPALKATFEMTLITKKGFLVLSNTSPVEEKDATESGWIETRFEPTPRMSTYLLCVVVGDYDYVEGFSARKIRIRVYTPPGKKEQGRFALDYTIKSFDFYEDYFKTPYPLSKCDCIAISDFSMGAMENWGLITYRETRILVDPANTSTYSKMRIIMTVAHEVAHQWFGNLVTMEWWTSFWLNEGFAKFMQMYSASVFAPEFDIMTQFPSTVIHPALKLDALDSSHPIEVEVHHPHEVEEIFDAICYQKGASVIAMLCNYLGKETFRSGLQLYMTRHAYGNTTTEDLWAAISEKSGQNINDLMDSWIKQMGFPVLSVKSRESGTNRILEIKQRKFYATAEKSAKSPQPQWKVPLVIGAAGLETTTVLLDSPEQEIEIKDGANAAWIHVNYGAFGVFRVHYDQPMLDALMPSIRDKSLSAVDRYTLHSDLFALVKAGYASTKELLILTQAYSNETELSVLESIIDFLLELAQLLDDQPVLHEKLSCFARQLLSGIFQKLGWDIKPDEKPSDAILRTQLVNALVTLGDESVLAEARRRFDNYIAGSGTIPADVRKAVYKAVAMEAHKQPALWDELMKLVKTTDLQEEIVRIQTSFGFARSKDLLLKTLEYADSDAVRSQDLPFVIGSVAGHSLGRELAWAHFNANFEKYKKMYNSGSLFHIIISWVGENFHSLEKAKEFQVFFQKHPIEGGERIVHQTLECIENNADWLRRDGQQIALFFNETQ